MNLMGWLTRHFSNRRRALSLYRRGRARARRHDRQGAIKDYTTAIAMRDTPDEVRAMALYYRALVHVAAGDEPKGVDDFHRILAMDEGIVNVKTMARRSLAGLASQSNEKQA